MSTPLLASIDWGTRLEGNVITYAFLKDGATLDLVAEEDGPVETKTLVGWNDYEQQQARLALSLFSAITPLTFVEVDDPAQATVRFALFDFGSTTLGWANPPGENTFGQTGAIASFNVTSPEWSREAGGALDQGGYGFITLTHEFGHMFGLAHPHDDGGGSPVMPGVIHSPYHGLGGTTGDFELNQGVYTMMSYNDGWVTGPMRVSASDNFGWANGPMALDIAILQQKYGAIEAGAPGTVYQLADADGPGVGYTAIWNTFGDNVIRYDGARDAVINLNPATLELEWGGGGFLSFVKGVHGGFTIAHGVEVTTAVSGDGNDTLFGNMLDNWFDAGAGRNTIHGNDGFNTAIYGGSRGDYSIDFGDNVWAVEAADESRIDVLYNVRGVQFDDATFVIEAVADVSILIGTLYHALLDRDPDAQGFHHWTINAFSSDTVESIAQNMTLSDEFLNGRGLLEDTVFVQTLYADLLDREGDAGGLQYWTEALDMGSMTRGEVALSFGMSDEFDVSLMGDLLTAIGELGDLWA